METTKTPVHYLIDSLLPYKSQIKINQDVLGIIFETARQMEHRLLFNENEINEWKDELHAAFKAGWMRANATNYNESYFNQYYDNI